jgi:hypothetical protein
LLPKVLRQRLAHDPRHDIDRAAGGKANQPAHRAVRIVGGGAGRDAKGRARETSQREQGCTRQCDHRFPVMASLRQPHFTSAASMLSYNCEFAYIAF